MVFERLGLSNRQERMWRDDLERRGYTQAQGKPKDLDDWLQTYNREEGTDYRLVLAGNTPEYAWNPRSFDPRAGQVAKCRFLMHFSEGVSDALILETIEQQLGLPALVLASALLEHWLTDNVLNRIEAGRVALANDMLKTLNEPEFFLRNKGGLSTSSELKHRLGLDDNEFRSAFYDSPPSRLVSDTIVLDLTMHNPTIDEVWVSNLVAEKGNVIPLHIIAEEIGLTRLGVPQDEVINITKRVCSVLQEQYYSGSEPAIMEVNGDHLSVGNPTEVVEAHIRRIEEYQAAWNDHATSLETQLDVVVSNIDEREEKLEQIEMEQGLDEEGLRERIIQAAVLQAYKQALFHTEKRDTA